MFIKSLFQAVLLTVNLFFISEAGSVRSYAQRSDLENVRPIAELGWAVPLNSGTHFLPTPSSDKMLKYLALGRGIFTFECNSPSPSPVYKTQHTDLFDVAPLAQNLPDVNALHDLVPKLCQYDYSNLRNSTMNCVGYIQTQNERTTIELFGFNEPTFQLQIKAAIPAPDPVANAYWGQSVSNDKQWQIYRVHTSGGRVPTSCDGHENSTIDVLYAAEYWFYHK